MTSPMFRFACLAPLVLIALACSDPTATPTGADTAAYDSGGLNIEVTSQLDGTTAAETIVADVSDASDTGPGVLCPGSPGCTCKSNVDCQSGMCIEDNNAEGGKACAKKCEGNCPDGFACANVTGSGGDIFSICVPKHLRLCDPCAASKDCESLGFKDGACLVMADGQFGKFCGSACGGDIDCPQGYLCLEASTAEGGKSKQCVKNATDSSAIYGQCGCTPAAKKKLLSTSCWNAVKGSDGTIIGKCQGAMKCGSGADGVCQSPATAPEVCNGQDDDCDGQTDEAGCDDSNPCTQDLCEGVGGCKHNNIEALGCDADGSLCTPTDTCKSGFCVAGAALNCDDGNPCTADTCDPSAGCQHTASNGAACDDDDPCTVGDVCQDKACLAGGPKTCTGNNACVEGSCSQTDGKCKYVNKKAGSVCDDGDVCTEQDGCSDGVCAGLASGCDDKNPCTTDSCVAPGGCVHAENSAPCEDGNSCTVGDICKKTICKGGAYDSCADGNPCTDDSCTPGIGCGHVPGKAPCSDGNVCTLGDSCAGGACVATDAASCDDGNPCTSESCVPTVGCMYFAASGLCDDGDACTSGDSCQGKVCMAGGPAVCSDGNVCTADSCNQLNGCVFSNVAGSCSDASACASGTCSAGKCSLPPGGCSDGNPCTADSCNGATGKCVFDSIGVQGKLCDSDGSVCTVGDQCSGGKCAAGKVLDCSDGNLCTLDLCDPVLGCDHPVASGGCNDGNACTGSDACTSGGCVGTPVVCNDINPCTNDSCNPSSGCSFADNSLPCSDGSACTSGDTCSGGKCGAQAVVCDDGNVCTSDSCDPSSGKCVFTPVAPAGSEVCGNGVDDNCNGQTDENCNTWQLDGAGVSYSGWAGGNSYDNSCGACTAAPTCPAGSVAVGYQGTYGAWLDHLQFTCQALNSDGSLGNMVSATPWFGSSPGPNAFGPLSCPSGKAMVRAVLWVGDQVQGITGYCLTPAEILAKTGTNAAQAAQGFTAGGGSYYDVSCPAGAVVTGINGYAGQYPHMLQLQCTPLVKK